MIDVVVVSHEKDIPTLGDCIRGIRENIQDLGRVIVVSEYQYTDEAEWFNERSFPFNKEGIYERLEFPFMTGWYFQQLIKLYAWQVIPDLSEHYLHIDADIVFMRPVEFIKNGKMLYDNSTNNHNPYFVHMKNMHPDFIKTFDDKNGMVHHILYYRKYIKEIFDLVEGYHGKDFWKVFCDSLQEGETNSACEMEIYFNYIFRCHKDKVELRKVIWEDVSDFDNIEKYRREQNFDFVGFHAYMRGADIYTDKKRKESHMTRDGLVTLYD